MSNQPEEIVTSSEKNPASSEKDPASPEEIAESLKKIYEYQFGGKEKGKYRISRVKLRTLSKLNTYEQLDDTAIEKIITAACKIGYIVVPVENYFAVLDGKLLLNLRSVTNTVLDYLIQNSEISESNTDEDDFKD